MKLIFKSYRLQLWKWEWLLMEYVLYVIGLPLSTCGRNALPQKRRLQLRLVYLTRCGSMVQKLLVCHCCRSGTNTALAFLYAQPHVHTIIGNCHTIYICCNYLGFVQLDKHTIIQMRHWTPASSSFLPALIL